MVTDLSTNLVNIEDEMRKSYLEYSMSVIVGRALPDVRDGLKPVHRRLLWGMHELRNTQNQPYKKSAKVVGEVMGNYHPHGDAALYEALVRLAQPWVMRHRLVDGHVFATAAAGERGPLLVAHCHNQRVLSDIKLAVDEPEKVFLINRIDGELITDADIKKTLRIIMGRGM